MLDSLPVKTWRDAPMLAHMTELAAQYPRYGYRRIQVFPATWSSDECGSCTSTGASGRSASAAQAAWTRVSTHRPRPLPAMAAGQLWAYDFVFDACANGQQLKCLTVIEEYTRECLAIDAGGSIRSGRVIEVLSRLVSVHRRVSQPLRSVVCRIVLCAPQPANSSDSSP